MITASFQFIAVFIIALLCGVVPIKEGKEIGAKGGEGYQGYQLEQDAEEESEGLLTEDDTQTEAESEAEFIAVSMQTPLLSESAVRDA